jgi:hypothetical protein
VSDDPWFIYRKEAGKFRAMPISWQGWCTFLGGIGSTIALNYFVMRATDGWSLMPRLAASGAIIIVGIGAICWVAYRKGRPSI